MLNITHLYKITNSCKNETALTECDTRHKIIMVPPFKPYSIFDITTLNTYKYKTCKTWSFLYPEHETDESDRENSHSAHRQDARVKIYLYKTTQLQKYNHSVKMGTSPLLIS